MKEEKESIVFSYKCPYHDRVTCKIEDDVLFLDDILKEFKTFLKKCGYENKVKMKIVK